jgi:DNA-binding NarL/FixJ family response regulator
MTRPIPRTSINPATSILRKMHTDSFDVCRLGLPSGHIAFGIGWLELEELERLVADCESETLEFKKSTGQLIRVWGVYPIYRLRQSLDDWMGDLAACNWRAKWDANCGRQTRGIWDCPGSRSGTRHSKNCKIGKAGIKPVEICRVRWIKACTSMKRITVLLAEDHEVVREGFRKLLEMEDDFKVIGEAKDGRRAVALVKKLHPTVVVMDVTMPLLNGLEAARQILEAVPSTRILLLSAHTDDAYIIGAMESGAVGFLLKQASVHDLSDGIREVNKGNIFFCPFLRKRLPKGYRISLDRTGRPKPRKARLSSREMEVLQLVAEGKVNKETAAELGVGVKTVENHRAHLMVKLDIHETAGLTRYAIGAGIIESSVQLTII